MVLSRISDCVNTQALHCFQSSKHTRKKNTNQFHQLLEKRNQLEKLTVVSVHKPALDGDPIRKLEEKQ